MLVCYRHSMSYLMEETNQTGKGGVLWGAIISAFCVIFLWGFWDKGPGALGINAAVYAGLILFFFVRALRRAGKFRHSDFAWLVPLVLLALSFALYENPFFKMFTVLVLPVAFFVAYNIAWLEDKATRMWNLALAGNIVGRFLDFFSQIGEAIKTLFSAVNSRDPARKKVTLRIIIGVLLLLFVLAIILPMLSSADAQFALKLGDFYTFVKRIVSASLLGKLIIFCILSVGTLSAYFAWSKANTVLTESKQWTIDAVVSGIVLAGILLFYGLFLWVQLDRLWVGNLPVDFKETESIVKSGFWQLLTLSFINLAIFFVLYRKTVPFVQKLLSVFTLASLLLLASSAHRMWLYVIHYGFSYEKFYAAYTVLFCGILFIWLLSRLFVTQTSNVFKFVAYLFLWMFAIVAVLPVEQIVVRANITSAQKPDSHIKLYEMKMLSADALPQIKEHYSALMRSEEAYDWSTWISDQEQAVAGKKWYEHTLSSLIARP